MIGQCGTLEISRSRLRHNLDLIRGRVSPGVKICATVKADAYGHGVKEVGALLRETGVDWVAVYSLEEAKRLVGMGETQGMAVLVLAPLVVGENEELTGEVVKGLFGTGARTVRVNVTDGESALRLSEALVAGGLGKESVPVHVQVDTGLTRSGADLEKAAELAEMIAGLPGLKLEGMFAHFSHGDVPGHESLAEQVTILHQVADPVRRRHPEVMLHMQNSGGVWHVDDPPPQGLEMVRVGIALYGLQPSTAARVEGLLPIARVTGPILAIHERAAGTGVGYGHTFVTQRRSRLAIVPVGYADGYPRAMSNRAVAQVDGEDVAVVGRVSMDQVILDVTDVSQVQVGGVATLISWDPAKPNCVDRMADAIGTIGYEIATGFGRRLRRAIVE